MTAIQATTAKTHLDHRSTTNPAWVFGIVGLVSPMVGCGVYAIRQRSWAYLQVSLALFVTLFAVAFSSPEGEVKPGIKVMLQLAAGGAAALVASNNKKEAKKELGIDDK